MDPTPAAIEVATARWEQWIGATLRAAHFRALTATAKTPRRRARTARTRPRTRRSLLWMLAVSAVGYWLLR
jgi:glutathione S-transferase